MIFIFTHLGYKHEQKFLRESGFAVLGMGEAEDMETDRFMFRQLQEELGMNTPETEAVTGIKELREEGRELIRHRGESIPLRTSSRNLGTDFAHPEMRIS